LLALQQICRQTCDKTVGLPFAVKISDVGIHTIQHLVAVVPRRILDRIKVDSIWKSPGNTTDQVDELFLAAHQEPNDLRV
jgi:S-ribosylhomocysteine lyase LuxS involved in autoinducer biosynthesis